MGTILERVMSYYDNQSLYTVMGAILERVMSD